MYIRFVLDPFVPHGINKVIRRVVKDLRNIFKDITYSIETEENLCFVIKNNPVPVSKIFQRKLHMTCRRIVLYIVNSDLTWKENPVYGISSPSRCVIGLKEIPKIGYKTWSAKIWDLILHELGHSFGLIRKSRARSAISSLGTSHCLNNCVMSEDSFESVWSKRARLRFNKRNPYCEDCLKYLISKDV